MSETTDANFESKCAETTSSVKAESGNGLYGTAIVVQHGNTAPVPSLPPAPNSKPREHEAPIETYVYRDFASAEPSSVNTEMSHERMPPQSLQSQKLPSKLAAMLSDPDLTSVITWMPHGRSWKILNRELFASFALPRYFGHSNHASFVRIVNAWGFRRISLGVDRDSYYHELFLRGKHNLHLRMKRLPSCHRKTPVDKDDKCPDFYELAKKSPLPEVSWSSNNAPNQVPGAFAGTVGGFPGGLNNGNMMGATPFMPETVKPIHYGNASGAFASSSMNGLMANAMGGGVGMGMGMGGPSSYGMADSSMLSLLGINGNEHLSNNSSLSQPSAPDASSLNAYTQSLQRENENLMLKIKLLEYENQAKQQQGQQPPQQQWQTGNTDQQQNNNGNTGFGGGVTSNANNNTINDMGGMGVVPGAPAAPAPSFNTATNV